MTAGSVHTAPATTINVGDTHEIVLAHDLTRTQIVQYAGASGDYNPLHSDEVFARKVAGSPTVFAHGMLTMGMTGRLLTDWFGPAAVTAYSARFVAQVWPGDTLTGRATVEEIDTSLQPARATLTLETINQRDETVLRGSATVVLDENGEVIL